MAVSAHWSLILRHFDVDPRFGFLLPYPQQTLQQQYQPWHDITRNLPELLESGELEQRVASLPLIEVSALCSQRELRLAHLLLSTLAAAHVWHRGIDKPHLLLPRQVAVPLTAVSKRLGLKPIICHASACLANWKLINEDDGFRAENLELIAFVFIRHPGNHWFFALTAQIEVEFVPALVSITKACAQSAILDDTFAEIRKSLITASATIKRMSERLPPPVFYEGFRHFLSGYTEGEHVKQGGIILEGREDLGPQLLTGGSAAQSSTLQAVDAFLQIRHPESEQTFLEAQRHYMPPGHRKFIEWIERQSLTISDFHQTPEYQKTLAELRRFRTEHIKVVTSYIVLQMKPDQQTYGTGGTTFMKLLKTIRNDC